MNAALAPLALAAALMPQLAGAVYMPMCHANQMTPAELQTFNVPQDEFFGYDVYGLPQGFAMFQGFVAGPGVGSTLIILEHCPTQGRLMIRFDGQGLSEDAQNARSQAVWDAVHQRAATPSDSYSFEDLAEIARALGATTEIDRASYQSCACATPEADRWN